MLWQWYRPRNDAFEVKTTKRVAKEKCLEGGGFVRGAARYQAWSLYDMDIDGVDSIDDCDDVITDGDIMVAWDIDREQEAGSIPAEAYEKSMSKLKEIAIMKGKKKARTA